MNEPGSVDPASVQRLAERLKETSTQLVFAESCTAGLAASTLAGVPGISQYFCGSAVVYQVPTKEAWLHIAPQLIRDEGVVSEAVALAMARGVLTITPQATVSAAITGDLGPDAPPETDGTAWIACATRDDRTVTKHVELPDQIADADPAMNLIQQQAVSLLQQQALRLIRQRAATDSLLQTVIDFLETE